MLETVEQTQKSQATSLAELNKAMLALKGSVITGAVLKDEVGPVKAQIGELAEDVQALKTSAGEIRDNARRSALTIALTI